MKIIKAQKLSKINSKTDVKLIRDNTIIYGNNWNYPSDIKAEFGIGFDDNNIYLSYAVEEQSTKAIYTEINDPVWEDSCVEFFISFDSENYYNLEFNCIGNVLVGYGNSDKTKRKQLDKNIIREIKTTPSLGKSKIEIINRKTEWELDIVIPKSIFIYNNIDKFDNKKVKCNFYKCGDEQVLPHFLSWSPIKNDTPNFHLPEFFGELIF